ncbi:prenyltransferase [Thermococcus henrietii]|uniref:prenyltransferase n=1 Tax=Thermococcus henrietii TaxID=2016361 RepID=UPI000C081B5B|nr:prenyltransferase [Thermococcus henrietii]
MLIEEALKSVAAIPDPYVRAVTYAKMGEKLAVARNPLYREAFLSAFESLGGIDDPYALMKALISIGSSLGRSGLKAYKRVFARILNESRFLTHPQRDEILRTASLALVSFGDVGEAINFALEISNGDLRQSTLVAVVRAASRSLERNSLKTAYRIRKIKLAMEYITDEPYRSKALLELSKGLISLGSYGDAFSAVEAMGSREWAKQAFKELAFRLSELGVIERYVESFVSLAEGLSRKFGEEFWVELATALALAGRGELAVGLLRKLGLESIKRVALDVLDKNPSALKELLSALSHEEALEVGRVLMNRILEEPSPEKKRIVNTIARFVRSEEMLAKVARFYVLIGDVESARGIGAFLQNPKLRSIVMADVAHHYLKLGRVEEAIDTALEVRDARFASLLMSEILIKAVEKEVEGSGHGEVEGSDGEARRRT